MLGDRGKKIEDREVPLLVPEFITTYFLFSNSTEISSKKHKCQTPFTLKFKDLLRWKDPNCVDWPPRSILRWAKSADYVPFSRARMRLEPTHNASRVAEKRLPVSDACEAVAAAVVGESGGEVERRGVSVKLTLLRFSLFFMNSFSFSFSFSLFWSWHVISSPHSHASGACTHALSPTSFRGSTLLFFFLKFYHYLISRILVN